MVRKKQNLKINIIKVLGVLLFASILADSLNYIILRLGAKSNHIILNIFSIIQFLLLTYIYQYLLKNKNIIYISAALFVAFYIVNIVLIRPFTVFQDWPHGAGNMILIIYSIIYFIQLLNKIPSTNIFRFSRFWLNTAVFYYFGATFLVFICYNYIIKTQTVEFGWIFWGFHNINNIIKNILFAIAIYYAKLKEENEIDINVMDREL